MGRLTATAEEGSNPNDVECVILSVIDHVLSTPPKIKGLDMIVYELVLPEYCNDPASVQAVNVANGADSSQQLPSGLVIGAALGGMCLVFVGLLVMRQTMAKKRDDNASVATKQTRKVDEQSSLEVTVNANETQQIMYLALPSRATILLLSWESQHPQVTALNGVERDDP